MSETKYLKCPCQKCGGSIEFPAQGLGLGVNCPHCGQRTTLFALEAVVEETQHPPEPPPPIKHCSSCGARLDPEVELCPECGKPSRPGLVLAVAVFVLLAIVAGASGFIYFKKRPASKNTQASSVPVTTNSSPVVVVTTSPAPPPAVAPAPKSLDDLKVGPITLEKAKSGSLIYAVGVLKNDSDHQRYGVKVELDVSDSTGSRTSKTSDQTQVIEPRTEWRFRALLLDSKAVTAKLSRITEDE